MHFKPSLQNPLFTFHEWMLLLFQEKTLKLCLNAGLTCPHRNGTKGFQGCFFCDEKGSGSFAGNPQESITLQMQQQVHLLSSKWKNHSFIAYFQNFSNTYGDPSFLKKTYLEALHFPHTKGIAIATRPDCFSPEIFDILQELKEKTFLWIELGLQTYHEKTAQKINRCFSLQDFEKTLFKLNEMKIPVVTHLIWNLPEESIEDMFQTLNYINSLPLQGVKYHSLHILKNTPLFEIYQKKPFPLMDKEEYISFIATVIENTNPQFCLHRLTGDGKAQDLVAPLWTCEKKRVYTGILQELKKRKTFQGYFFKGEPSWKNALS